MAVALSGPDDARTRLLRVGPDHLNDADLLQVVLTACSRGRPVASQTAADLLRGRTLEDLASRQATWWRRHARLGPRAAADVTAAFQLATRLEGVPAVVEERPTCQTPEAAYRQVRDLGRRRREHLVGLYLDTRSRLIRRETVSIGSLNTTRAHPREFLRPAIEHGAAAFILAHNHPSGSTEPSPEDLAFTRAARDAAALLDFELFDHLIVTRSGFVSLRQQGLLDGP